MIFIIFQIVLSLQPVLLGPNAMAGEMKKTIRHKCGLKPAGDAS
jgi:hypothetical protein